MSELVFRGGATAEEVAVITAVLSARAANVHTEDAYQRWRRTRLTALRADPAHDSHPRVTPTTG